MKAAGALDISKERPDAEVAEKRYAGIEKIIWSSEYRFMADAYGAVRRRRS